MKLADGGSRRFTGTKTTMVPVCVTRELRALLARCLEPEDASPDGWHEAMLDNLQDRCLSWDIILLFSDDGNAALLPPSSRAEWGSGRGAPPPSLEAVSIEPHDSNDPEPQCSLWRAFDECTAPRAPGADAF